MASTQKGCSHILMICVIRAPSRVLADTESNRLHAGQLSLGLGNYDATVCRIEHSEDGSDVKENFVDG
jgi:hypothetical protein